MSFCTGSILWIKKDIIVTNCDGIFDINFEALLEYHINSKAKIVNANLPEKIKSFVSDNFQKDLKYLEKKYAFVGIILGLPINMNGTEGPRCQSTRSFATKLSQMTNHFICLWDERLSTLAAEKSLISSDISRKSRTKIIDKIAACYILQGFLDRLKNS